ncbi:hypothetical protein SISSUDRAFT_1045012 [Sistotremastrum suecicum HHB10207 ss-3]|uniref:Uncharacterized protein n=1 Tax=Sistotremastrum suecicum HHB10207 ss-3 TaxID=1314776 RepID=A0A166ERY3_9AGAM|nr:hypothetical protein SISSUDRAFT_1045012 [Sistotremastrum suecicum HHB10207 ss-3]
MGKATWFASLTRSKNNSGASSKDIPKKAPEYDWQDGLPVPFIALMNQSMEFGGQEKDAIKRSWKILNLQQHGLDLEETTRRWEAGAAQEKKRRSSKRSQARGQDDEQLLIPPSQSV